MEVLMANNKTDLQDSWDNVQSIFKTGCETLIPYSAEKPSIRDKYIREPIVKMAGLLDQIAIAIEASPPGQEEEIVTIVSTVAGYGAQISTVLAQMEETPNFFPEPYRAFSKMKEEIEPAIYGIITAFGESHPPTLLEVTRVSEVSCLDIVSAALNK